MNRILVIGGAGFIGSSLIARLVERGDNVRALDRAAVKSPLPDYVTRRVDWVEGDFGGRDLIERTMADCNIVFHLVSTTLPKSSNDDPLYDVRSNLCSTVQLLSIAAKAGVQKIIFPSSGGTIYGVPDSLPISESHPTNPLSSYGITKLAIEKYLELFRIQHRLDYTVLRISNPFGPYHNPRSAQGAVGVFLARALERKPIEVWGDGEILRDYIYISDVIDAMLLAMERQSGPRLFNVGSGEGRSLNQVIATIRRVTKLEVVVNYLPARSVDVPSNVLDIKLIKAALGWSPIVDFEEGVGLAYEVLVRTAHC